MRLITDPRLIVPTGIGLVFCFLLLDAAVDTLFFNEEGRGFVDGLLKPEPMDLWMRLVVAVFMLGFAFHARLLLRQQIQVAAELARERDLLQARIVEATQDLRARNEALISEVEARRKAESELETLAITDPLTQLYNRRRLLEALAIGMDIDRRYRTGLSLVICDIDHFKVINDTHGHGIGDAVLRQFADVMRRNTRTSDTLARWGGEEFALLMPLPDVDQAMAAAEKLRLSLEREDFDTAGHITASFGVAMLRTDDTAETFMQRADKALYAAKDGGRNKVVQAA